MVFWPLKKRGKRLASVSLEGDGLRYLELSGDRTSLRYERSAVVLPLPGALKQDMVGDMEVLSRSLARLEEEAGRFVSPVAVGIPSRDVLIRLVDMPPLSPDDAREALRWDFDRHFPFPVTDAAYDVAPLDLPGNGDEENRHYLVAACRLGLAEGLVGAVEALGVTVSALEPLNLALFRAGLGPVDRFDGGHLQVHVGFETSEIMLGYREGGILFRTVMAGRAGGSEGLSSLAREVDATRAFIRSRFRDLSLEEIVVTGQRGIDEAFLSQIRGEGLLPVAHLSVEALWGIAGHRDEGPREGLEAAVGLCVRALP